MEKQQSTTSSCSTTNNIQMNPLEFDRTFYDFGHIVVVVSVVVELVVIIIVPKNYFGFAPPASSTSLPTHPQNKTECWKIQLQNPFAKKKTHSLLRDKWAHIEPQAELPSVFFRTNKLAEGVKKKEFRKRKFFLLKNNYV